jgi:hypothetical protein
LFNFVSIKEYERETYNWAGQFKKITLFRTEEGNGRKKNAGGSIYHILHTSPAE